MKILRFMSTLSIGGICCSLLFLPLQAQAHGGIDFVGVFNTEDGGQGSLRAAILHANDDADTQIVFQIPVSDKNYDPKTGIFTIEPRTPLPAVKTKGTIFDGLAQTLINDSNKSGPEIRISGKKIARTPGETVRPGIIISAPNCEVKGLILSDFAGVALSLRGEDTIECRVQSNVFERNKGTDIVLQNGASANWIGIAPSTAIPGVKFNGVYSDEMSNDFFSNQTEAIRVSGDTTVGNSIRGNRFYNTEKPFVFNSNNKVAAPVLKIDRMEGEGVRHRITVEFTGKPNQEVTLDLYRSSAEDMFAPHSKPEMTTHVLKTDENGRLDYQEEVKGYPVGSHMATVTTREGQTSEISNIVVLPYLN